VVSKIRVRQAKSVAAVTYELLPALMHGLPDFKLKSEVSIAENSLSVPLEIPANGVASTNGDDVSNMLFALVPLPGATSHALLYRILVAAVDATLVAT